MNINIYTYIVLFVCIHYTERECVCMRGERERERQGGREREAKTIKEREGQKGTEESENFEERGERKKRLGFRER